MNESTITYALLFMILNFGLSVGSFVYARKKDTKAELDSAKAESSESAKVSEARELANKEFQIKTQMKLDQICNTTSETRTDIKSMEKRITDVDKRLFHAERTIETMGGRICKLENASAAEIQSTH